MPTPPNLPQLLSVVLIVLILAIAVRFWVAFRKRLREGLLEDDELIQFSLHSDPPKHPGYPIVYGEISDADGYGFLPEPGTYAETPEEVAIKNPVSEFPSEKTAWSRDEIPIPVSRSIPPRCPTHNCAMIHLGNWNYACPECNPHPWKLASHPIEMIGNVIVDDLRELRPILCYNCRSAHATCRLGMRYLCDGCCRHEQGCIPIEHPEYKTT